MLKYAVLILWRKKGVPANFYAFCISASLFFSTFDFCLLTFTFDQRCKKRKNEQERPFFSKKLIQHILAYFLPRQPKN